MPCDTRIPEGMTVEQRKKDVEKAVERLERALSAGAVTVKVGPQGSITFSSWAEGKDGRDGVSDLCAYRRLAAKGSWALRQAVVKAEATSGRKVDQRAIGAGFHTHDGGKTWSTH